jgi:hypothetical protein
MRMAEIASVLISQYRARILELTDNVPFIMHVGPCLLKAYDNSNLVSIEELKAVVELLNPIFSIVPSVAPSAFKPDCFYVVCRWHHERARYGMGGCIFKKGEWFDSFHVRLSRDVDRIRLFREMRNFVVRCVMIPELASQGWMVEERRVRPCLAESAIREFGLTIIKSPESDIPIVNSVLQGVVRVQIPCEKIGDVAEWIDKQLLM